MCSKAIATYLSPPLTTVIPMAERDVSVSSHDSESSVSKFQARSMVLTSSRNPLPSSLCYGSVKNGFDSAILTRIPRMKKEERAEQSADD
jgi:hypothetical protein